MQKHKDWRIFISLSKTRTIENIPWHTQYHVLQSQRQSINSFVSRSV